MGKENLIYLTLFLFSLKQPYGGLSIKIHLKIFSIFTQEVKVSVFHRKISVVFEGSLS